MKTVAVIAEFNPFHTGHEYMLSKIRETSRADNIIVLMSGNFVQRGAPAVTDKYTRTKAALLCGADLVLELPLVFSLGSAPVFAEGAVHILNRLNCIDELWFGSETGEISSFNLPVDVLKYETEEYSKLLRQNLKAGQPFPLARINALASLLSEKEYASSREILSRPNNILGFEYCLALKKSGSRIIPKTILRLGSDYDSTVLNGSFSSASAIREALKNSRFKELSDIFPQRVTDQFDPENGLVFTDDFSAFFRYKIMSESANTLSEYHDTTPELAGRIKNHENRFTSIQQFATLIKSKNYTYTHICRSFFHILLNLTDKDIEDAYTRRYVRMLGLNKNSSVMNLIKEKALISVCAKPASLDDGSYEKELFASNLYEAVQSQKANRPFIHEFSKKAPVVYGD